MALISETEVPYDEQALRFATELETKALADYIVTLVKFLSERFFEITDVVNINASPPNITITANYTATQDDRIILADSTSGVITISLPSAELSPSRTYNIIKIDASVNLVTIDAFGAETINGSTTISLTSQYEAVTIYCTGSTWYILS